MTLSFGTYGTKGMPLMQALQRITEAGFDGVELAVFPGFEAEPSRLTPTERTRLQRWFRDHPLRLTAMMENLPPASDDAQHRTDLDRLKRVTALWHDLTPQQPPLVQTVMGSGRWEDKKNLFRDRLGDWLTAVKPSRAVVAIKPHRFGAMSKPADAIWLIEQLGRPAALRMVYDYSHYAFRDLSVEATVREALPYTAHVAVKDAVRQGEKVSFALPGSSNTFDYADLFRRLHAGGYAGDVACEVSGQVSGQPGYDAAMAITACARAMTAAWTKAGVPRP
jgi:sugar phosphate isomerase/epimerase